jgi:hypothetical protein
MTRVSWVLVLDEARDIVAEYDTDVTLRQLFYRLVSKQLIPNLQSFYRRLSARTAEARRDGSFPDLADETSEIHGGPGGDTSPADALRWAADSYRRDHSEGQPVSIYLAVEKRGMVNQLESWFGDIDVAIVALGGYASQSYCDEIRRQVARQNRPAILLYAGDHDPSGEDIERDFIDRTDCWKETRRIALTPEQVTDPAYQVQEYVPTDKELEKLERDPRAKAFEQRHGSLVQYELDALDPTDLRYLYQTAIDEFWDESAYADVLAREHEERNQLITLADEWQEGGDE